MKSFVAASGVVKIDRYYEKSYKTLARDALSSLEKNLSEDISPDTLIISSMASELVDHQSSIADLVADYLGLKRVRVYRVESGEASGLAAFQLAHSLISSGASKRTLVIGVDKGSEAPVSRMAKVYASIKDSDYMQLHGASPLAESAILAKLYMKRYEYAYEDLFIWPYTMHQNSPDTPHAQLRFKINIDSYKDSPILAEPLRLLDAYPFGDGAVAIYIVSEEAREKHDLLVSVEGFGASVDIKDLSSREDLLIFRSVRESWEEALNMAGVDSRKIKYVEIHDNYTPNAFIVIESIGLTERGRAPEEFEDSRIGDIYLNLSGGLKARGNPWGATGLYQVHEIFSALTGSFKNNVLGEIEYAAAQNMNGIGDSSYVIVLRRVR
ncbi:MAG: thiolase family protein [Sulfolobales archaeon]